MPSEDNSELWSARTPPEFRFNVKAFSLLTDHPTPADALPPGFGRAVHKARLYRRDLTGPEIEEIWDRFLSALSPLERAGKLGGLLFQFPPWFGINSANKAYIAECAERCAPRRVLVELRSPRWTATSNDVVETEDLLRGVSASYVTVDMPQGMRDSVEPISLVPSDLSVIRLHGRNAGEWHSGSVQRRFAYLYSDDELGAWVPKIRQLQEVTPETHVLFNNCYSDYAPRNAQRLVEMLEERGVPVLEPRTT